MKGGNLITILNAGICQLELTIPDNIRQTLLAYLLLLQQWNKTYNLTAIRDLPSMVVQHVLDSLSVMPYIKGARVLDVGTGAGLPGIPLALVCPDKQVVLLDSRGKKIQFLLQVQQQLQLNNVSIVQSRVEDYQPKQWFTTIVTRAFADLATIWRQTQHLLAKDGCVLAMKGQYPKQELLELNQEPVRIQVHQLTVPNLAAERCVVILKGQDKRENDRNH